MASREKAGTAVLVVGVVAALFLHANTGDTGRDTDVCTARSGESLTQTIRGTFDKNDPYQRCMNQREGDRLLDK
jgi:hypothetical protein